MAAAPVKSTPAEEIAAPRATSEPPEPALEGAAVATEPAPRPVREPVLEPAPPRPGDLATRDVAREPVPRDALELRPRIAAASEPPRVDEPLRADPPAVHVTIGRVDVRAVFAAPTETAPAAPSGPPMSLDDYLKSRDAAS